MSGFVAHDLSGLRWPRLEVADGTDRVATGDQEDAICRGVFGMERESRLTQEQAAMVLGVSDRTFRRYIHRYEEDGIEGLSDGRFGRVSFRRAPVDEVMAVLDRYRSLNAGWTVKHYYRWYQKEEGKRSYTWVKKTLQSAGLVSKAPKRGVHRKRRDRSPLPGMLLHQDGSRHEWVPGKKWDLIVTMDDATSEHYSMFFVAEEGTASSFQGVRDVILQHGSVQFSLHRSGKPLLVHPEGRRQGQ